jgi:TonB family protein
MGMRLNDPGLKEQHDAGHGAGAEPVFGRRASDQESLGMLDPGLAPNAFEGLLDACGADIVVLSADAGLIETVRQTSGAHPSIDFVDDWPALVEAVGQGRCGIVLLDMDHVGETLDNALIELERQAVPPVIVAASTVSDAPALMKALTARRIHRLLLKPASPGKTRLLLGAAVRRSLQLREHAGEPPADGTGSPWSISGWFSGRQGQAFAIGMAAVFVVVVAAGLLWQKPRDTAPADAPQQVVVPGEIIRIEPPPEETVVVPDPIAGQLERAQRAFDEGRLVEPAEDNALDIYMEILAEQPEHAEAIAGLAATIELLFTWAESALLGGVPELASSSLDHVRRVRPESARLAFLDAQLERALEQDAQDAATADAAETAAQPREIDRILGIATNRMRRGLLTEPAQDSALAYYKWAARLDANDPDVVAMRLRLGATLVAAARQSLEAGEIAPAETLIAEAGNLRVDAAVLAELDERLRDARVARQQAHQAGLLERGVEQLRAGQLITPEADSAAYYLASLRAENPGHPGLAAPWQALNMTLAANFREAIAAADWSEAETWLGGLERIDADPGLIGALAGELSVARTQAGFLRTVVPAEELQLIDARTPVYPQVALRNGTEGWVELEFIVDRNGRPREILVTAAEPAGTFERAATNAVERYRFEPYTLEGVTYERRARLRIRFALN